MAILGLQTPAGTRAQAFFEDQAVLFEATVPVNCTIDYIGVICYESATANENDLIAFVWASSGGSLIHTSNILTTPISSTSISTPTDAHITFSSASLTASTTYIFGVAATGRGGTPIVVGQNGSGLTPTLLQNSFIYGSPPNPITGGTITNQPREWGVYLSYTASGGGGGGASNQRFFLLGVG